MKIIAALLLLIGLSSCSHQSEKQSESLPYEIPSPAAPGSGMPNFAVGNGKTYMSWIEKLDEGMHRLNYALWEEGRWGEAQEISRGKNWFANWADFPAMASFTDGRMAAHWLQKSGDGTFHYDVMLTFFDGLKWLEPQVLNTDGLKAEHGFVSMAVMPNGELLISWLDGRNTASEDAHAAHSHEHGGEMSLRAAIFDKDFNRVKEWELDNRVCDCCQTSALSIGDAAMIWYRDRSESEVRDISMLRFEQGEWSEPQNFYADNWEIAGCPVNGPSSASLNENILVAWYAMNEEQAKVKFRHSGNGGQNFESQVVLNENPGPGRVHVCAIKHRNSFGVTWLETLEGETKIMFAEVDATKGNILHKKALLSTSAARASGFPRIAYDGKGIVLAYTQPGENNQVKTVYYELEDK
jgi:hypothetical protein